MSVFKRIRDGAESATYYCKFMWQGKQVLRNTSLATARDAEAFERDLRKSLATGRADVLEQIANLRQIPAAALKFSTLGELRDAFRLAAGPHLTARGLRDTVSNLALVVTTVLGPEPDIWTRTADCLTADLVRTWQSKRLDTAGPGEQARASAKISANACLRAVRAMFKRERLAAYAGHLVLPDLDAFLKVPPLPETARQYTYKAELVADTLAHATAPYADRHGRDHDGLKATDPAAYLAFLLAFGLGLRRGEAIAADWTWFETRADGRVICHLQGNAAWRGPKGKRERLVPVDPTVWAELKAVRIPSIAEGPDWVLPGNTRDRNRHVWRHLSTWMKAQGWTTRQKAHELRKAFGARVASSAGLFAAQKLLGHAQAMTTSRYYADLVDLPDIRVMTPIPAVAAAAAG